jgi:hypothetical protein
MGGEGAGGNLWRSGRTERLCRPPSPASWAAAGEVAGNEEETAFRARMTVAAVRSVLCRCVCRMGTVLSGENRGKKCRHKASRRRQLGWQLRYGYLIFVVIWSGGYRYRDNFLSIGDTCIWSELRWVWNEYFILPVGNPTVIRYFTTAIILGCEQVKMYLFCYINYNLFWLLNFATLLS